MNTEIKKTFWFNLLLVFAVAVVLYILFFISLGFITRHGKEVKVPNVTKRTLAEAQKTLEDMDFEVVVDSAYEPKQKPFVVLSQIPDINSVVKKGRTVFLTINKKDPPSTPMPNLVGLSFRSAEMILKNNKLALGDTSYKPDIAKGAILEQLYKGITIRPGQLVPQGSRISLVIGDGLTNVAISVPDVLGYVYPEAMEYLSGSGLQPILVWEGTITDSAMAMVYKQEPRPINELDAPNRIKEGDMVTIFLKQQVSPEELEANRRSAMPPPAPAP
ncbi:MAG: PASTA domain-containing protein [Flavipsychrobacter sp.]|nr:PASTA domain-containing protein [Flavipsychrobacter sp.]